MDVAHIGMLLTSLSLCLSVKSSQSLSLTFWVWLIPLSVKSLSLTPFWLSHAESTKFVADNGIELEGLWDFHRLAGLPTCWEHRLHIELKGRGTRLNCRFWHWHNLRRNYCTAHLLIHCLSLEYYNCHCHCHIALARIMSSIYQLCCVAAVSFSFIVAQQTKGIFEWTSCGGHGAGLKWLHCAGK